VQGFFDTAVLIEVWPLLAQGLAMTALLTVAVVPGGVLAGLVIAVLFSFRLRPLNVLLVVYIDFLRSFPPLVLIILIFYALPFVGVRLSEVPAFVLALVLNASSYYGEIFRAGIQSIPKGQFEAARSTGLGPLQTMAYVVLPQAVRNVLPPLVGNTIELVKGTSLASVVAIPELLRNARIGQSLTYSPTPLIACAVIYLALMWPAVRLLSRMERRVLARR
jgi:polar amino acid transport system permease protein